MKQEIIINAAGKKPGRIASQIALALRGKKSADFLPHSKNLPKVSVKNIDEIDFSEKKLKAKKFKKYSGYPGGLKRRSAWTLAVSDKREVLRHAINGMLPKNKLRKIMLKNLTLRHGE